MDPREPKRAPVTSSQIKSIGFDKNEPLEPLLEVEFNNGAVYQYCGVTQALYDMLMHAESIGKFFNQNIRNKFPHKKLEPEPEAKP